MSEQKKYFRGDNVFLYNLIDCKETDVIGSVQVRILRDYAGDIFEELSWSDMGKINNNNYEYFLNHRIPLTANYGQYQVIYSSEINSLKSYLVETFVVVPKSEKYVDFIEVFGYVKEARNDAAIGDASLTITNVDTNEIVATAVTFYDGKWEAFVYPGNYEFIFNKFEYDKEIIHVQIGDESNEIQFNTIGLLKSNTSFRGDGIYRIGDGSEFITKQGTPLPNLKISVFSVFDPSTLIAYDVTDNDGNWHCFLNEGSYLLKINGYSFGVNFDKTMRLKISQNGDYYIEDISKNVTNSESQTFLSNGSGNASLKDSILDKKGNPIVNVQVNAFNQNDLNTILAQDYTDINGNWSLNLNPGTYVIECYHPSFKTITEKRTVN